MTVEEFIKMMQECPPQAEVKAEDWEGHYEPVVSEDGKEVRLYYEH